MLKLGYLHVYRLDPDTTANDLEAFLLQSAPDIEFCCKSLNRTDKSASFIVTFPIQHVGRVYSSSLWPSGAHVNRYYFPRKRVTGDGGSAANFIKTASTKQTG